MRSASGHQAHERDVTKEFSILHSTAGLVLERGCLFGANAPGSSKHVCTPIDDGQHVLRFGCLRVAVTAHAREGKADRSQAFPHASRQPRILDKVRHHGIDGTLERVEGAGGDRGRHVVTVEHRYPAASTKHSIGCTKGLLRVWNMAQRGVEYDEVKRHIREGNGQTVCCLEGQP
jgi:hypothetical protein